MSTDIKQEIFQVLSQLSIGLGLFESGLGRAWVLKNCRASIGPDAGENRNFQ